MDIQFNDRNGNKPEGVKNLIRSMLNIIALSGLSMEGLKDRNIEQISMACLAMGGIVNSLDEIKSTNYLTSKEIIRFWNQNYQDTMSEGSYDSIRDNSVKKLVENGIAVSEARESSRTKNSSTAGYGLSEAFVELVKAYGTNEQEEVLKKFKSYQASIDLSEFETSKKAVASKKVSAKAMKKAFLLYLQKTSKQMQNYDDYIDRVCKKIDPLLKKCTNDFSSVYEITTEQNLVSIIQDVINQNSDFDGLLESDWDKTTAKNFKDYVLWTTIRQYRDYLILLNAASFIFSVKQPTLSKVAPSVVKKDYFPYFTALRTKPFLLLAGISGTGKSQKVQELAFMSCTEDLRNSDSTTPGNYQLIEVKPNWHDSTELLGYYSALSGKYELTDFIRFTYKAIKNENVPFFLCLDEMNLAPVEQYFAEFLSVLETRKKIGENIETQPLLSKEVFSNCTLKKRNLIKKEGYVTDEDEYEEIPLYSDSDEDIISFLKNNGLHLPDNLFVIGTVNMDDTTHQFSRKVIDRAFTIEMNGGKMSQMFLPESKALLEYREDPIKLDAFKSKYVRAYEVLDDPKFTKYFTKISTEIPELLGDPDGESNDNSINGILNNTPFRVSYRVQNELVLYLSVLIENADFPEDINPLISEATLAILLEKILPRVQGEQKQLETKKGHSNILKDLHNFVESKFSPTDSDSSSNEESLYAKVLKKLEEMDTKLGGYYTNFF